MNVTRAVVLLLCTAALAARAAAQPAPAPAGAPPPLAAGKLQTVTDAPRFFKVVSVTLGSGEKSSVTGPAGTIYQMSGSTTVSVGGQTKTVNAGEGFYIPAGAMAQLQAGNNGGMFLHFFLAQKTDLDKPAEAAPALVKELYRSKDAIPDLKAGVYDINLARGVFAAQTPLTAPHHRSGAALYYIATGTAINTIDGKAVERRPGSFVYEPYRLVHQWSNPTDVPAIRVVFNINPEGVPAVQQGAPQ